MKAAEFDIQTLADTLQGTCMSFEEAFNQLGWDMSFDDMTQEECEELDTKVMRCHECDWWHETGEMNEDEPEYCTECRPNDE